MNEYVHSTIWDFIKDEENEEMTYFYCSQSQILQYAIRLWGNTLEARKSPVPSDYPQYHFISADNDLHIQSEKSLSTKICTLIFDPISA